MTISSVAAGCVANAVAPVILDTSNPLGYNAFFNSPSVASSIITWSADESAVTKVLAEIVSSGIPIVPTLFA